MYYDKGNDNDDWDENVGEQEDIECNYIEQDEADDFYDENYEQQYEDDQIGLNKVTGEVQDPRRYFDPHQTRPVTRTKASCSNQHPIIVDEPPPGQSCSYNALQSTDKTHVLYENKKYSTRFEDYESETDSETELFFRTNNKSRTSDESLRRHGHHDYTESRQSEEMQGFGRSEIMRPLLSIEEQRMLGLLPSHPESKSMLQTVDEENFWYLADTMETMRSPTLPKQNHCRQEVEEMDHCHYDDPAAAGDFSGNFLYAKPTKVRTQSSRTWRRNLDEKVILAVSHAFNAQEDVALPQLHSPEFELKSSTSNRSEQNCITEFLKTNDTDDTSKPILRFLEDGDRIRKSYAMLSSVLSLPILDLCNPSKVKKTLTWGLLDIQEIYASPNMMGSNKWRRKLAPCGRLDRWKDLPGFFGEQNLYQDFLSNKRFLVDEFDYQERNYAPRRCKSDTSFDKCKRTLEKRVHFTYTSCASFFADPDELSESEFKHFPLNNGSFGEGYFLKMGKVLINKISKHQEWWEAGFEKTEPSSASATSSSVSGSSRRPSPESRPNSAATWVAETVRLRPTSLESDTDSEGAATATTSGSNNAAKVDVDSRVNSELEDSSEYSEASFSGSTYNCSRSSETFTRDGPTPSRTRFSSACDRDDDDDFYFFPEDDDDIEITDKMIFKFLLDESGTEAQVSVKLPFPIPVSNMPMDSPLFAAAVLEKAHQLVLQGMGMGFTNTNTTSDHPDNPNPSPPLPCLTCSSRLRLLSMDSEKDKDNDNDNPNGDKMVHNNNRESKSVPSVNEDLLKRKRKSRCRLILTLIKIMRIFFLCECCRIRKVKIGPSSDVNVVRKCSDESVK